MAELLNQLDSNKRELVEEAKQKLFEQLGLVRDSWLVQGLYEYYLSTNSANTIVILVNIKEPHHLFLFDRLSDSIGKSSKTDVKVQALTLLGHVVRNQPTWLYKLPEHQLLKAVLKLLKCEVELLPLLSALLVLIVLIPMIPYSMGELLNDIFEIFSRLASWNCNPGKLGDDQMVHMQIALYALFLRLYGMFPCNFLAYLRTQYKDKNRPVFVHTIKPMLESVKMNPSLVTTSKDNETTSERWKKMEVHDVIVECERFSLDVSDTCCAHDSCQLASGFRSRSGTANSALEPSYFQSLKTIAASMSNERPDYFSPSMIFNPHTPPIGGVSIPYVTQPEFTHDENVVPQAGSSPPETAIEATPETTPLIPEDCTPVRSQAQYPAVAKALSSFTSSPTHPHSPKERSPFTFPSTFIGGSDSPKLQPPPLQDRSVASNLKSKSPTSPLRIKSGTELLKMSPTKSSGLSGGPDEEIMGIERIEQASQRMLKQSDSVLHESEDCSDHLDEDRSSPCTAGGLHMPNSKSLKDFAKHVQRLRHHSQCNPDLEHNEEPSSSPEMGDSTKVRRANSCPEMKKSPVSSIKDNVSRILDETDEDERAESAMSNGVVGGTLVDDLTTAMTQTENFWPMPYEHLFLGIFPSLEEQEVKPSPGTAPANASQEKCEQPSIYEVLDKYLETAVKDDRDEIRNLQKQLQLVHQQLLFERHRREIHAFKNRRFLADAKSTQQLEEHNSALRDQVQLQQTDIDNLRTQLDTLQSSKTQEVQVLSSTISRLEDHCKTLEHKNKVLKESEIDMQKEIENYKAECLSLTVEKQKVEASLLDALAEVKFAKEKASAGEKGRAELEFVNKQLLLIGELQLKYNERLEEVTSLRRSDRELELLKETYSNEHRGLTQRLREKGAKLEAYVIKVAELEQLIQQNDETISAQKRTLNSMNEDHDMRIKAIEQKYQTQLTICRSMDEKMLGLWQQLEERAGKAIRSPDTSSCQEVQVPSDKVSGGATGVSERSSPLSVSLASSDGSSALAQADMRELKGLQALVDEESPGELDTPKDFDQPSTSKRD